jgi:hypothetical protein
MVTIQTSNVGATLCYLGQSPETLRNIYINIWKLLLTAVTITSHHIFGMVIIYRPIRRLTARPAFRGTVQKTYVKSSVPHFA